MKLYRNLDVIVNYQDFGSQMVLILRGKTSDIELAVNGLYNFGGTSGSECEYFDGSETVAFVWTNLTKMRRFFFWQFLFGHLDSLGPKYKGIKKGLAPLSRAVAARKINTLIRYPGETLFRKNILPDFFGVGTITAERPDDNFKEQAIQHGYND